MESKIFESITILQKKHYGCLAKVFCCKCMYCCQGFDFSLLTSEHRKQAFQQMIKKYIKHIGDIKKAHIIMDPFLILVALFLGQEHEIYGQLMKIINNYSEETIFSQQDLEFYIPELCTYLVFHEDLKNIQLLNLMMRACKIDIHFSLKYYFYMKSLEFMNIGKQEIRKYECVSNYNKHLRNIINNFYKNGNKKQKRNSKQVKQNQQVDTKQSGKGKIKNQNTDEQQIVCDTSASIILKDQEQDFSKKKGICVDKQEFNLVRMYQPHIFQPKDKTQGVFSSTINFFMDLIKLSEQLTSVGDRKQQLTRQLVQFNKRFPALVYIPFTKKEYQHSNIINIVQSQCRVFSTKQRAPYYICMEIFYNATQQQNKQSDKQNKQKFKGTPRTRQSIGDGKNFEQFSQKQESQDSNKVSISQFEKSQPQVNKQEGEKQENVDITKWSSFFQLGKKIKNKLISQKKALKYTQKPTQLTISNLQQLEGQQKKKQEYLSDIFGQSSQQQFERIKNQSSFGYLPGYQLIHIMVKSNDDLRQESFAMQLLQQFDKIFKLQNLPVKLLPYEVLPLSHSAGIIQFVKDAVTIDQLRKKGKNISKILNSEQKMKNFVSSLAAYSLITYLLQVKDRHNGNIMIKSDGHIFHIDYGFFLSNLPGKGVQLQKNLPFKLTNQYVEALGGIKSKHFQDFRKLFFQAFSACKRHQHKILILTRLMYTSFGKGMPCFMKGNQALQQLQERFNPKKVSNEAQLSVYCQSLINSSIDNWRSRWYDKWQYYVQGILY